MEGIMRDELSAERRRIEAALVRLLRRAGVPCEALAPLVAAGAGAAADWAAYRGETCADPAQTAAEVNECELEDQVRYILDEFGLADGEARLMALVWSLERAA
jgi:hypothetical protein